MTDLINDIHNSGALPGDLPQAAAPAAADSPVAGLRGGIIIPGTALRATWRIIMKVNGVQQYER